MEGCKTGGSEGSSFVVFESPSSIVVFPLPVESGSGAALLFLYL